MSTKPLSLAVVCPFFNEEENLEKVIDEITFFIRRQNSISSARIILVDDGSIDNSLNVIKNVIRGLGFKRTVSHEYPISSSVSFEGILRGGVSKRGKNIEVILLRFLSNRGQSFSVRSGLQFAEDADWSIVIDSDGQHTATSMNALWELKNGALVVNSKQKKRHDSKAKFLLTKLYYFILKKLITD